MSQSLQSKRYTIDFFQVSHTATPHVPTVMAGFEQLLGALGVVHSIAGYTREVWQPINRCGPDPRSVAGQFRKFRTSDLPEIGAAGQDSAELELAENQGLIERNFFVYYEDRQLLGWCRNGHGNTVSQFANFLSACWGTKVQAGPILQPDAAKRLMRNGIELKAIEVTLPRPTNPEFYPEEDFSKEMVEMLRRSGADTIHLTLGINTRRSDTGGSLASRWKHALAEVTGMGASTARAVVYDDGIEHPIDLIADRVVSYQDIETNARFPPSGTMYEAIDAAREECKGSIYDYFSSMDEAVT